MLSYSSFQGLALLAIVAVPSSFVIHAMPSNIHVTVRGKSYNVGDVETVEDIFESIQEQTDDATISEQRLLFDGKQLDGSQTLAEAGVDDDAHLNVVPNTSNSNKTKKKKKKTTSTIKKSVSTNMKLPDLDAAVSNDENENDNDQALESKLKEALAQAGIDPSELDDMMKNMPSDPAAIQESMSAMTDMMNSPLFQQYMNDPEKLEQTRQMILSNPMFQSNLPPEMKELLNDPVAWREAMQAAASMFENMDTNELMSAMMGGAGAGGAGGMMPPGLFDGNMDTSTLALDELSEGED